MCNNYIICNDNFFKYTFPRVGIARRDLLHAKFLCSLLPSSCPSMDPLLQPMKPMQKSFNTIPILIFPPFPRSRSQVLAILDMEGAHSGSVSPSDVPLHSLDISNSTDDLNRIQ